MTKKKTSPHPCIGCRLRQQELDRIKQEETSKVFSEVVDVFLTVYNKEEDVLIYDPSHRIYQHFIKDPDVYEMITLKENTYSMKKFSLFLEKLLNETLDEATFHLYQFWDALYRFFQKEEIFWCTASFEETFGSQHHKKQVHAKRKKIIFYFVKKN
jgi:hypothetical protein